MQMRNLAFRGLRLPRLGAMMQSGGFSPADVFTPADVFGATDIGLFNRIHPDNLFTDTNGTINAAVGDAVAYIEDLSGNENHRIQSTAAKRPTLQQDPNGAYKLVYDGVDDFIDVTYSGVISTPVSTVSVVRKAPNRRISTETTDTSNLRLNSETAGDGTLTFYARPSGGANPSAVGISIPVGVEILILGTVWAQENSLYRINGVQNTGVFDPGPNSETAGYRTAADNANPPAVHTVLEEYGAIQIDRELTTEQFEQIEDYFELEVGIAHSGGFSPASLFAGGTEGAWYDPSDLSTLFQDSAGTTPVTAATDPVGYFGDKSGRANHAVQATAAARPTYQTGPARATLDKVDDRLSVTVPVGGFTGTMVLATDQGTASYGVTIPAGAYEIGGRGGLYFPGTALVGQLIRDGALSEGEAAATEAYFVENGATAGYGSVTDFGSFWRDWSEITSFPLINTSAGTSFSVAWSNCSSLTSFPLINTSSGTNFSYAWRNCTSLTSFPLINTSAGTNFSFAWRNCDSLTSFPLINTSAGTNFSYAWLACKSLTSFPLIDTSAGTSFSLAWSNCSSLTSFPLINTSAGTNFKLAWRSCTSLTSFPLIDTSAGTNFARAWENCSSLTSFPLIDTSSGTNFDRAWRNCSSLTSFPANAFDNVKGGDFTDAFTNTALTQTSIDNILVSLVTSGIATGTRVFDQSGGSAPSAAGEAAIDTLRSRGWTVTVKEA